MTKMTDDSMIERQSEQEDHAIASGMTDALAMDIVQCISVSHRRIGMARDAGEVHEALVWAVQALLRRTCSIVAADHADGDMFPLLDCGGTCLAVLQTGRGSISSCQRKAIETMASHAGLMLGCLAMQDDSAREITARQVAEFEAGHLRASFDRRLDEAVGERSVWADVFRGSQYSVCIVSQDLRYVSFNPSFEAWFVRHGGFAPLTGMRVADALQLHPVIAEEAQRHWRKALSGHDFTHSWHLASAGREYHYETRYAPLRGADGDITGAVQFSLDVTDRIVERERLEIAEAALRQSQKMEAVGKLTGGIAHDFNNILTGIVGALDIIGRKMTDGKLDAIPRYIEMASTSANRAASLTHRLLAFSRKQPVDPRLTDIDALILGMGEMITRTMGPDVSVETSTGVQGLRVLCDPSQLESAMMNLAVNAREAMPAGGRLLIASTGLAPGEIPEGNDLRPGPCVRITISDTGCGMSAEVLSQAIEPFFTTKGIRQGTGLGLSMVYGFARQSGGHLDIQSVEGEGTTVSIYLPAALNQALSVESDTSPVCDHDNATILVVEDEPAVRTIVVEMLEEMGCQVIQAEDGGEGASILSSDVHIDMLVTDIGLPVLNGRQVATVARTSRPDLPILFMTGYSDNATITEGFGGRTTLVTKPFRPGQIADAIGRMLS